MCFSSFLPAFGDNPAIGPTTAPGPALALETRSLMNSDNMTTNSGNLAAASVDHSAAEAAEEDFM